MSQPIETYITTVLNPRIATGHLRSYPSVVEAVAHDVRLRLYSLLSHWQEVRLRRTILFIGGEEATWYHPTKAWRRGDGDRNGSHGAC